MTQTIFNHLTYIEEYVNSFIEFERSEAERREELLSQLRERLQSLRETYLGAG